MNYKYKVLFLLSNPVIGGTETFIMSIVPLLRLNGIDARVANVWPDSVMEKSCNDNNISFKSFEAQRYKIPLKSILHLVLFLRREKFDIIYVLGLRMNLLLRFIWLFVPSCKMISGVRNVDTWRKWYHIGLDRITQRLVDCTVCNSYKLLEIKSDREKTPESRLSVIYNGIDTEYFSKNVQQWPTRSVLGLPENRFFVSVANIRHTKGHAFYLDAIYKAVKSGLPVNIKFLWIGKGPLEARLKEYAEKLDLSDRIIWAGKQEDVRPYLFHSEAFVLSSKEEGMPRAMIEAMSMELPVLCTDVGGNSEVVRNGIDGIVVKYGDVDQMANALMELSSAKWLNTDIGNNNRKRVLEEFALATMVNEHIKLFDNLVADQTIK